MAKVEEAFDIIKGMTILELRDLNKKIEDEFGITAAAPAMMMAAPAAGGGGGAAAPAAEEEQTEFNVVLKDAGANKINVSGGASDIAAFTIDPLLMLDGRTSSTRWPSRISTG